jgi:hypothetical protein
MKKVKSEFHQIPSSVPWKSYRLNEEGWDETYYFKNKDWSDLSIVDFNHYPYCLSFFDLQAFPFFWGAMMFLSLKEEIWECRALENYLAMWENLDPSTILLEVDVRTTKQEISAALKKVLNKCKIDLIEEYFDFRRSTGYYWDDESIASFVAHLRGY